MFNTSTYLDRAPRLATDPAPDPVRGGPPDEGGPTTGDPPDAGDAGVAVRAMGGGASGAAAADPSASAFLLTHRPCSLS